MHTPTLRTFRIWLDTSKGMTVPNGRTYYVDVEAYSIQAARSVASGSDYWTGEIHEVTEGSKRHAA